MVQSVIFLRTSASQMCTTVVILRKVFLICRCLLNFKPKFQTFINYLLFIHMRVVYIFENILIRIFIISFTAEKLCSLPLPPGADTILSLEEMRGIWADVFSDSDHQEEPVTATDHQYESTAAIHLPYIDMMLLLKMFICRQTQ